MSELRVGIVGIGGAGRAHVQRFMREKRARVSAVLDTKQTGEYREVPIERDLNSFLAKVDAISVCAPDMDHLEYCVAGLEAGKHVLVEKPMVGSLEQADELRKVVEANPKLVFAVHQQMRYAPAFLESKKLLKERDLAPLFQIEANYWHDMRERNTRFDDWRVSGRGQSVLFGAACHPLDLLMWLMDGEDVESVAVYVNHIGYPQYVNYTNLTALLRFSSGAIGKINANNCARYPQLNDLVLLAEGGTIVDGVLFTRDWEYFCKPNAGGGKWTSVKSLGHRAIEKVASFSSNFRRPPFSRYAHEAACRRIVQNFVSAVHGDEEILVPFEQAYKVIRVMEEMEAQAAQQDRSKL